MSPDTATLAECGVTRSMGVWEYLWEDSAENQASFREEKEKVRGMVTSFMKEFPDVGRKGKAVNGEEDDDEPEDWDEEMKKKRAEMEAAVEAEKEKKKKKQSALEQMAEDAAAVADKKEEKATVTAGAATVTA